MSPTKEKLPNHLGFFLTAPFRKLEDGNENLDYYLKAAKYVESKINQKNGIAGLPIKIHIHTEKLDENITNEEFLNYLKDKKHVVLPPYPISVILELVNRCNLECTMCYQGFRNDAAKSTLQLEDLKKIFSNFEKNKLDALLLSASEPLLYKNFDKVFERVYKNLQEINFEGIYFRNDIGHQVRNKFLKEI